MTKYFDIYPLHPLSFARVFFASTGALNEVAVQNSNNPLQFQQSSHQDVLLRFEIRQVRPHLTQLSLLCKYCYVTYTRHVAAPARCAPLCIRPCHNCNVIGLCCVAVFPVCVPVYAEVEN